MNEMPYGSVSPPWPAPIVTWPQSIVQMMNRPAANAVTSQPFVPIGTAPAGNAPAPFAPPNTLPGSAFPVLPNLFAFGGAYPFAPGLGAPSIASVLAAVAIRRGQPNGPGNDQELEDFVYDVFELLPGTNDVEIRCEGGRATLTGNVQHKRLKHDVGEIVWAIPSVNDVQNNVTIATKRRARAASREPDQQQQGGSARKQA